MEMSEMSEMSGLGETPAGTILLGDLRVQRLGFGTMRISVARNGAGLRDSEAGRALVRHAVDRGVTFLDTANIYGLGQSEELIAEALRPYPSDVVIGTKSGYETRRLAPGEQRLPASGRPEHLMDECDKSLRRLGVDQIDVYQLHTPDPSVPYAESLGALVGLQRQGKIRHIGISNVTVDHLTEALSMCHVVSVQNRYNVGDRGSEPQLQMCEQRGIAFIPWQPIGRDEARLRLAGQIALAHQATPQQIVLAWLLRRSPVMLPIPGTTSLAHLDANIDAAWIELTDDEFARLGAGES
jgi:aryl-alcohol dehydrogenase-like predicted oxidoreductase